jgi:hypothetical protein
MRVDKLFASNKGDVQEARIFDNPHTSTLGARRAESDS